MAVNKKIKLILAVLIIFIICIFSIGYDYTGYEPEDDAGFKLHPDKNNRHMGSEYTSYSFSDQSVYYEGVEIEPDSYEDLIESAEAMWVDKGKEISGNNDYQIIDMEDLESGGMGTIQLVDYPYKRSPARTRVKWISDPDTDYLITEWTLYINVARFEERNDDGTYRYDIETKRNIIAHEIGHIFGLGHAEDTGQIMYESFKINEETGKIKSGTEEITESDIQGMEICTENFETIMAADDEYCSQIYSHSGGYFFKEHSFTSELVVVGTEEICKKEVYTCSDCGYSYEVLDITHEWTDESDTECNDCGYVRLGPFEIVELEGLLTITINGQVWVLNYSEEGTEHEWSQYPPKFSELHGYNSVYVMRCGRILKWSANIAFVHMGTTYYQYCYNFDDIDYYHGQYWWYKPDSFRNLRLMTEIIDNDGTYHYLRGIEPLAYPQYVQTTMDLEGIFWAQLCGDAESGYYVLIRRALAYEVDDSIVIRGQSVWEPPIYYPVYFGP